MATDIDGWGVRHPLTVLQLESVQVIRVSQLPTEPGFKRVQVGGGFAKPRRLNKAATNYFSTKGLPPKIKLAEFKVSEGAELPVGTEIVARHFVPGQKVDVTGVTQGKGFQGAMKRWGFAGQPATHGVSKAHRSLGSTGNSQNPGKVWKGKKMAGKMGNKQRTVQGLEVHKIDVKRNLLYVRGAVPGRKGTIVRVRDALKWPFPEGMLPPFPTYDLTDEDLELAQKWIAIEEARAAGDEEAAAALEAEVADVPYELVRVPDANDPEAPRLRGDVDP